jgi:hypothetical protein
MQQFLKPTAGQARTWIVTTELFRQMLVPAHDSFAALDVRLGREPPPTFARDLETRTDRAASIWFSWHTSGRTTSTGARIVAMRSLFGKPWRVAAGGLGRSAGVTG